MCPRLQDLLLVTVTVPLGQRRFLPMDADDRGDLTWTPLRTEAAGGTED